MNQLENIEMFLTRISKVLVFFLLAFMSTSVFYAVICRYIFHSAPFWVEEVARFMMVYMAFFGAAVAFQKRGHAGLEFVVNRLISERFRPYIILFTDILTLIFFFFVIYHGVRFASRGAGVVSPATGISMLIAYCGVPIGCSFCFIQVLINIVKELRKKAAFKSNLG
jgi:TRAP-type C4-dicarboxylate transport system permease small subunit